MIRLWSRNLGDFAHELAFSPRGDAVVLATLDGALTLLDAATGEPLWSRSAHAGGALTVAFSPDCTQLASGGQDGCARVFDAVSGEELAVLDAGGAWVSRVVWSEAWPGVLALAAGREVRFWRPGDDGRAERLGFPSTVSELLERPQGAGFCATHYGGASLVVPGTPEPVQRLPYRGAIVAARLSPDGRFLSTGNQDATVRFWDLTTKDNASLTGYTEKVTVLAWDARSTFLVTGGGPNVIAWACAGPTQSPVGSRPLVLSHHARRVRGLAFTRASGALLSCAEDGRLCRVVLAADGVPSVEADDTGAPLFSLVHDAARGFVACAGAAGAVHLWRVEDPLG